MHLRTAAGVVIEKPDMAMIKQKLETLHPAKETHVSLVNDERHYIRADVNHANGYALTLKDGSDDRHYRIDYSSSLRSVLAAFESYLLGDNRWRTRVEWHLHRRPT